MPCDTVSRSKIEFLASTTNVDLLTTGLEANGFTVRHAGRVLYIYKNGAQGIYEKATGRLSIPESWDSQEFKRVYSVQVVTQQAKENGWEISWTTNDQGEPEATVERQSF